jgi:hypothetical protein
MNIVDAIAPVAYAIPTIHAGIAPAFGEPLTMRNLPLRAGFMLPAALAATLLGAGCGHKDTLVGTWSGTWTNARVPGASYKITTTYNADGTGTNTEEFPYGQVGGGITYDLNGDGTLTQTATSVRMNGKSIPLPPNKSAPAEVFHFQVDGDVLTLEQPKLGTKIVMERAK